MPDYDDQVVCGALLDPKSGGLFLFGREKAALGEQRYEAKTACLVTRWSEGANELELVIAIIGNKMFPRLGDL